MVNVSKILVNNGWTITNRRILAKNVGNEECKKIVDHVRSYIENGDRSIFTPESFKLDNCNDSLILTMKAKPDKNCVLTGKGINFENIYSALRSMMGNLTKETVNFNESKTLEKLYTPEFKPQRRKTPDGYYVTTVINRATEKPEEVFIRLGRTFQVKSTTHGNPVDVEIWSLFRKSRITNTYEEIGWREFEIDKTLNIIMPGHINAESGNNRYRGIGIRLHQLGIERMIQENLDNVRLTSTSEAFPFHYKCGFRVTEPIMVDIDFADFTFTKWAKILGVSPESIKQRLVITTSETNKQYYIDNKEFENLKKELVLKTNNKYDIGGLSLELDEEHMSAWKKRIESQPILI